MTIVPPPYNIEKIEDANLENTPSSMIISTMHRLHFSYLNRKLEDYNITFGQVPFLIALNDNDHITQKELANAFSINEGVVTRALQKLQENKLIDRIVNQDDKREKIIIITSKGKELADVLISFEKEWEDEVWSFLSEDELKKLKLILHEGTKASIKLNEDSH